MYLVDWRDKEFAKCFCLADVLNFSYKIRSNIFDSCQTKVFHQLFEGNRKGYNVTFVVRNTTCRTGTFSAKKYVLEKERVPNQIIQGGCFYENIDIPCSAKYIHILPTLESQ